MKTELLMRIKEAEEGARKGIATAEAEAKKILADARRQADAIAADGREQAEHAHSQRMDAARKKAQGETAKAVEQGEKTAAALRERFEAGLEDATGRVLKFFEERI